MADMTAPRAPAQIDYSKMSDEQLKQLIAAPTAKTDFETPFEAALFSLRSAAEGHTLGVSEPVISGAKAGIKTYLGGEGTFKENFDADVAQRKAEKEAHPAADIAAQIGGAIVPSPVNLFTKTLGVATAGAKALGLGGRALLPTVMRGAVIGGTAGAGQQAIKEAVERPTGFIDSGTVGGDVARAAALGTVLGPIGEVAANKIQGAVENARAAKPETKKIIDAGKTLGAEPTLGQLSANRLVQKLESSLEQRPGFGGGDVKEGIFKSKEAPGKAVQDIAKMATSHTSTEVGFSARKGILDAIAKKLEPAEAIYDSLENQLSKGEATILNSNNTISDLRELSKTAPQLRGVVDFASDALGNVQTIDHLKNVRTAVGSRLNSSSLEPIERRALGQIYDALTKDRSDSLIRLSPGSEKALQMADSIYRDVAEQAQAALPIKNAGPKEVEKALDRLDDTSFAKNVFNTKDVTRLQSLQKTFPQQFDEMRQLRIQELVKGRSGEPVTPSVLVDRFHNLEPEARALIFGKDASNKIEAISTWLKSMPGKLGPSGTPEGMHYQDFILKSLSMVKPLETYGQKTLYLMLGDAANSIVNPVVRRATLQSAKMFEFPGAMDAVNSLKDVAGRQQQSDDTLLGRLKRRNQKSVK
jgi:hypothetical protein